MRLTYALSALAASSALAAQNYSIHPSLASQYGLNLRQANASYGPPVEEVHYYTDQLPIGLAVASDHRIFVCYTRGTYPYTVGLVTNQTHEVPFPPANSSITNLPVSALNTTFNTIPFGVSSPNLVSVQALIVTSATRNRPETLWVVDTGRPSIMQDGKSVMPYAQPGGPKLLAFNLTNGGAAHYKTYTFPPDVHYPDSYLNDVRIDLRSSLSDTTGQGVAYLVDSSDEGRPGFIILDLGTGTSWRRLTQDPSVLRVQGDIPSYLQKPFYYRPPNMPISSLREGLDGIQLSGDGSRVYYSPLTSRELYSVPSANLRTRPQDPLAELAAHGNISSHGRRGGDGNGFEGDDKGRIYMLMPESNGVYYYDPNDLQVHGWFSDPRVIWPDSANVGQDGYMYININQLYFQPVWNNGTDLRRKPGAILRVKLPDGAGKLNLG